MMVEGNNNIDEPPHYSLLGGRIESWSLWGGRGCDMTLFSEVNLFWHIDRVSRNHIETKLKPTKRGTDKAWSA